MDTEPVSIYLDLEKGSNADIEVIAGATLALVAAIKEAAYIIDPSVEIRIELESGTEGSLVLNTVLKAAKAVLPDRPTLKALAILILCWFATDVRQYGVQEVLNRILKGDAHPNISDDDKQKIEEIVVKALEKHIASGKVQEVYQELERDEKITGVGATQKRGKRPDNIVPRQQFRAFSENSVIIESATETRTTMSIQAVTIVSPVLVPGNRVWRFRANNIEFGAKIADVRFQRDLLSGRRRIPMRSGIQMIVELKTEEEKIDGVWTVRNRTILRVLRTPRQPFQQSLDLPSVEDE